MPFVVAATTTEMGIYWVQLALRIYVTSKVAPGIDVRDELGILERRYLGTGLDTLDSGDRFPQILVEL